VAQQKVHDATVYKERARRALGVPG
jgi:hypothetical protein